MSKQVNLTVYRYEELTDEAKRRAENNILYELYEHEEYWMDESLKDFENNIFEDEQYRFDQLPENICYEWDFSDYLGEYEGTKSGKWLISEFKKYLKDTWDKLAFEDEVIEDWADSNNMYFYEDGIPYRGRVADE